MHVEQLGEIIPPPIHNTVGVCNQEIYPYINFLNSITTVNLTIPTTLQFNVYCEN
jgi:hypothetical protein